VTSLPAGAALVPIIEGPPSPVLHQPERLTTLDGAIRGYLLRHEPGTPPRFRTAPRARAGADRPVGRSAYGHCPVTLRLTDGLTALSPGERRFVTRAAGVQAR